MTNRELVEAAWAEALKSTISGVEWQNRVTNGYKGKPYNWQATALGRAKALLDQVVDVPVVDPPPPPPPPPPPSAPSGVAPPIAPGVGYRVPDNATRISSLAALRAALGGSATSIVYSGDPGDGRLITLRGHKLYADSPGKLLSVGVDLAGAGSELHGFTVRPAAASSVLDKAGVLVWAPDCGLFDTTVDGSLSAAMGAFEHGVKTTVVRGFRIARCRALNVPYTGFYLVPPTNQKVPYGTPCDSMQHVSDLYAEHVHLPVPGSSHSGEAGIWLGAKVTEGVQRIEARACGRKGIETSVNWRDTTVEDFKVDVAKLNGTGNCIYHEHDGWNTVWKRGALFGLRGVMCEWDEGGSQEAGANDFVWEDVLFDGTGYENFSGYQTSWGSHGIYLDEGTRGGTIRRWTFRGCSRAAVNTYRMETPLTVEPNCVYDIPASVPRLLERHWASN